MLFIFRKIRRSFFLPGKVRTYMAYAIGEIVLIMVGILLALQVSDWNQARKDRAEEIAVLSQIQKALEQDLVELDRKLTYTQERSKNVEELWDHVLVEGPYRTELNENFTHMSYKQGVEINRAPFENLKSRGLDLISNEDLLLELTSFYENEYAFIMRRMSNITESSRSRVDPFQQEQLHWSGEPLNYEQLIEDPEFLFILERQNTVLKLVLVPGLERVINSAEELAEALRAELQERGIGGS